MRGLNLDREDRHCGLQREAAPQYVEIREDVNHHRESEGELQALSYECGWQRKRWRVWRDSRYVANFSPGLHQEDRLAEEPSAPTPDKGNPHPRAATLGDFMEVARRSKDKPARPLQLKRSGSGSDVEWAHRGALPRPGPSASSSSSLAPPFSAPQRGKVARGSERVCGVLCNLRIARERARQQNAALEGAVLIAQGETARRDHGMVINASAVAAISAAPTAPVAREAAAAREARAAQEAMVKEEAEVKGSEQALAQERARKGAEMKAQAEAAKREAIMTEGDRGESQD